MTFIEDCQEGQSKCAYLLYKDSSCVGSDIGNYSVPTVCLCMQALTSAPTERLPSESVNERGIRLQQIVPVSVKNWQLKPLKRMPDFDSE